MLNNEELTYLIIQENLDSLITSDLNITYTNIKEASIIINIILDNYYNILNEIVLIEEGSFFNYISSYFTDPQNSHLSNLFNFGFVGADFGAKFAFTGQFGSGIAGLLTNLGIGTGAASAGAATAPFIVLLTGFAISKYLSDSEVRLTKQLLDTSKKTSNILKFNFNIPTKFNKLVKDNCLHINKKNKHKCASNLFINEYVRL